MHKNIKKYNFNLKYEINIYIIYETKAKGDVTMLKKVFNDFVTEEKGQTLIELVLVLTLLAIVVIVAMRALGNKTKSKFSEINNNL